MSKYSSKKASSIIMYVLLFFAVALAVGFTYRFTNGFKSDFATFYVQQGDTKIFDVAENYPIPLGEKTRFDVKYTFGFMDKEKSGYSVKIVPNISGDNDFEFMVNGLSHGYGYPSYPSA